MVVTHRKANRLLIKHSTMKIRGRCNDVIVSPSYLAKHATAREEAVVGMLDRAVAATNQVAKVVQRLSDALGGDAIIRGATHMDSAQNELRDARFSIRRDFFAPTLLCRAWAHRCSKPKRGRYQRRFYV